MNSLARRSYRNPAIETEWFSEVDDIAVSYVRVRRIELDHEQRVVEGPEKYLRLSHRGLELMNSEPDFGQGWLAKFAGAFDDEPLAPLDPETAIHVRNVSVYSKEKDAGLDWLRNASIGGIIGALTPGKFVACCRRCDLRRNVNAWPRATVVPGHSRLRREQMGLRTRKRGSG